MNGLLRYTPFGGKLIKMLLLLSYLKFLSELVEQNCHWTYLTGNNYERVAESRRLLQKCYSF